MDGWVSYEATVVWLISNPQYLTAAIAFSVGPPFRKYLFTNILFTSAIVGVLTMNLVFNFMPGYISKAPPTDVID
jgi:cation-transporting ATPase 13A2